MNLPARFSAQPLRRHWCMQKDVEPELGLEGNAISIYVVDLDKGTHGKKVFLKAVSEQAAAGVYRVVDGKWA